ncbi:MAG: sigma-54-dependent Fis family transcriptional regulator [Desulfobacterales bacterium]|nr:sigma-54-dependent Fis family transcriptional regulator [Desulfobacterales bacterium]
MAKILIIDDDNLICETLSRIFKGMGHETNYALTLEKGREEARGWDPDIIFLDVRLPDGNGLENLPEIQDSPSNPEVIILTGYADPDGAELAIENNAWDYLKKPASMDTITQVLNQALQYRREKQTSQPTISLKREGIIGKSPALEACLDLVARSAGGVANILISGETGTGKELFARTIHANSARSRSNFVVVDCGSLPETLMESLLFGHTKGAFTGADKAEDGLIKNAAGGTLFLDEIGELSLKTQKIFLRVLQERRFYPVGAVKEIKSDFRLISASNRNLDEMVEAGSFRADVLFRLRTINIELPPRRERTGDVKELSIDYMLKLSESHQVGMKGFAPNFFKFLEAYDWPGNVRELFSVLEWTMTQALHEQTIFPKHLPAHVRTRVARSHFHEEAEEDTPPETANDLPDELPPWKEYRTSLIAEGEKRYLRALISRTDGNVKKASGLSGISAPRLYELLRKHQIPTR